VTFSRKNLRSACWLALLACLLQACWPVVANASPYAQQILVKVCSLDGASYVTIEGKPARSPDAKHHLPHCAFCSAVAGKLAPPPVVSRCPLAALTFVRVAARGAPPEVHESISPHASDPRAPPFSL
jgi:hypothetical protein